MAREAVRGPRGSETAGGLPDRVVTLGGHSKVYHRNVGSESAPRPRCKAAGRSFHLKDRAVVEPIYRPCERCFPRVPGRD